jgi:hypothetical protein
MASKDPAEKVNAVNRSPVFSPLDVRSPINIQGGTHNPSALQITLRQFDSGKLTKAVRPVTGARYIAISHVWGKARWQNVLEEEVLVSDEKARFLKDRLYSVVGDSWFWMDVLCIDQHDKDSRVAITQHIPEIFKNAQKTIVVRNSQGFRDCCARAVGLVRKATDVDKVYEVWVEHLQSAHLGTPGGRIDEQIFARLWPHQELALSHCVQFVRCDDLESDVDSQTRRCDYFQCSVAANQLLSFAASPAIAMGWGLEGGEGWIELNVKLSDAFINGGIVSRPLLGQTQLYPSRMELTAVLTSTRVTGHPRDFILAVMPQYGFYTVPKDARRMSFGELFVDCFRQGERAQWPYAPLISADWTPASGTSLFAPTTNIPEPRYLGDMIKLMLGGGAIGGEEEYDFHPQAVEVRQIDLSDCAGAIRVLRQCSRYSTAFQLALGERHLAVVGALDRTELPITSQIGVDQDEVILDDEVLGLCALDALEKVNNEGSELPSMFLQNQSWTEPAVRVAALLSCGIGSSAYVWSKDNLTPVLVKFRDHWILALVWNSVAQLNCRFLLFEAAPWLHSEERWTFVVCPNVEPRFWSVGFFPPVVKLNEDC